MKTTRRCIDSFVRAFEKARRGFTEWCAAFNATKAVAMTIVACFLISFVTGQSIAALLENHRESQSLKNSVETFAIPSSLGRISEAKYFGSDEVVINIQDLHCHPEVQRNISKILSLLDVKYRMPAVYLEGAWETVDTSWLAGIKDTALKGRLTESLLAKGQLTGAEYFSVATGKTDIIRGIEDKGLYLANLKRLNTILASHDSIESLLDPMDARITNLKREYFNADQKKFDSLMAKYAGGSMEARKYYTLLKKHADKLGVNVAAYPNFSGYIHLMDMERGLDYRRTSRELGEFVKLLRGKLPYSAYNALVKETDNFSNTDRLNTLLIAIARDYHLDLTNNFPALGRFFSYIETSRSVNPLGLVREERVLVRELRDHLPVNRSQREVAFLDSFSQYFRSYATNKISADEYTYFCENLTRFKQLLAKYTDSSLMPLFDPYAKVLSDYYAANLTRNDCFLKNIACASASGPAVALNPAADQARLALDSIQPGKNLKVVVTGGFHTEGLSQMLTDKKITHLIITPNVTQDTSASEKVYVNAIREQAFFLDQAFANPPASVAITKEIATDVLQAVEVNKSLSTQEIIRVVNGILINKAGITLSKINATTGESEFVQELKKDGKPITIAWHVDKEGNWTESTDGKAPQTLNVSVKNRLGAAVATGALFGAIGAAITFVVGLSVIGVGIGIIPAIFYMAQRSYILTNLNAENGVGIKTLGELNEIQLNRMGILREDDGTYTFTDTSGRKWLVTDIEKGSKLAAQNSYDPETHLGTIKVNIKMLEAFSIGVHNPWWANIFPGQGQRFQQALPRVILNHEARHIKLHENKSWIIAFPWLEEFVVSLRDPIDAFKIMRKITPPMLGRTAILRLNRLVPVNHTLTLIGEGLVLSLMLLTGHVQAADGTVLVSNLSNYLTAFACAFAGFWGYNFIADKVSNRFFPNVEKSSSLRRAIIFSLAALAIGVASGDIVTKVFIACGFILEPVLSAIFSRQDSRGASAEEGSDFYANGILNSFQILRGNNNENSNIIQARESLEKGDLDAFISLAIIEFENVKKLCYIPALHDPTVKDRLLNIDRAFKKLEQFREPITSPSFDTSKSQGRHFFSVAITSLAAIAVLAHPAQAAAGAVAFTNPIGMMAAVALLAAVFMAKGIAGPVTDSEYSLGDLSGPLQELRQKALALGNNITHKYELEYFYSLISQTINAGDSEIPRDLSYMPEDLVNGTNKTGYVGYGPSALLMPEDRKSIASGTREAKKRRKELEERAKNALILYYPMNGGLGTFLLRDRFLQLMWEAIGRLGQAFRRSAKASDLYEDVTIAGLNENRDKVETTVKVNVAEKKLLQVIIEQLVHKGFAETIMKELASDESVASINELYESVNIYGRCGLRAPWMSEEDEGIDCRTYKQIFAEENGLTLEPPYEQQLQNVVDENNELLPRLSPGGHGFCGFFMLLNSMKRVIPQDRQALAVLYNSDGINNGIDPFVAGLILEDENPLTIVATTRRRDDRKVGLLGLFRRANGDKFLTVEDPAGSEQLGQLDIFNAIGITIGEPGAQYINTNTVIGNISILQPFLKELEKVIGKEELRKAIAPTLMRNKKQDGDQVYNQVEGTLGTVVLNLNKYLETTKDPAVKACMKYHRIGSENGRPLVKIVNIDEEDRINYFTPVKYAIDFWLQSHSDIFKMNTETWKMETTRPGHVPNFDLADSYYTDLQNCIDAFGHASTRELDTIEIKGIVEMQDAVLKGTVRITNNSGENVDLNSPENRKLLGLPEDGPLILENVIIEIQKGNKISIVSVVQQGKPEGLEKVSNRQSLANKIEIKVFKLSSQTYKIKFGTSGWRDKISGVFNAENIHRAAEGYIRYLKEEQEAGKLKGKNVYIVGDARKDNKRNVQNTAAQIAAAGFNPIIIDLEATPTPVVTFLAQNDPLCSGVINFTASHNPGNDNGMKISDGKGGPLDTAATDKISKYANDAVSYTTCDFETALKAGSITRVDVEKLINDYRNYIVKELKDQGLWDSMINQFVNDEKLIYAIDCMQGASVKYYEDITNKLESDIKDRLKNMGRKDSRTRMYFELINTENNNPDFPQVNGAPNPTLEKHNESLRNTIAELVGDGYRVVGLAADGDSDRFGFFDIIEPLSETDPKNAFMPSNEVLALAAAYRLEMAYAQGHREFVYVRTSATSTFMDLVMEKFMEDHSDAKIVRRETAVGFKYAVPIIRAAEEEGIVVIIAGESSAHVGFNSKSLDDGILLSFFLAGIVASEGSLIKYKQALEEKTGKRFLNEEDATDPDADGKIKVNFDGLLNPAKAESDKDHQLNNTSATWIKIAAFIGAVPGLAEKGIASIDTVDGIRVIFKDGSNFIIRYSGTEAKGRIYTQGIIPFVKSESRAESDKKLKEANKQLKIVAYKLLGLEPPFATVPSDFDDDNGNNGSEQPGNPLMQSLIGIAASILAGLFGLSALATPARAMVVGQALAPAIFDHSILPVVLAFTVFAALVILVARPLVKHFAAPLLSVVKAPDVPAAGMPFQGIAEQTDQFFNEKTEAGILFGKLTRTQITNTDALKAFGVKFGESILGAFALNGGYFNTKGKERFLEGVRAYSSFFDKINRGLDEEYAGKQGLIYRVKKALGQGKKVRVVIKCGIGGQITPWRGIAAVFNRLIGRKVITLGWYELGLDYENILANIVKENGLDWDQIAVIASSKSGSTDETMIVFTAVLKALAKNKAQKYGLDGQRFADAFFAVLHDLNTEKDENGVVQEKTGGLFKVPEGTDLISLVTERYNTYDNKVTGFSAEKQQVQTVFRHLLRGIMFETTDNPDVSRLAAFVKNSGLSKELGEDANNFVEMFDNVGGRWTFHLHMMAFLGLNRLNADKYWETANKQVEKVRNGSDEGRIVADHIIDQGKTNIALLVPDSLFEYAKAIEQNVNESIWQGGFVTLKAVSASNWESQGKHYSAASGRNAIVVNLTDMSLYSEQFDTVSPFSAGHRVGQQNAAQKLSELTNFFFAMTSRIGSRLIIKALAEKGYSINDVDLNDVNKEATKTVIANLFTLQPNVELGKGFLEKELKDLQGKGGVEARLKQAQEDATQGKVVTSLKDAGIPAFAADVNGLTLLFRKVNEIAAKEGRQFIQFVYLAGAEGEEGRFVGLREYLISRGSEWVLQGTGDQHISYQQVLEHPEKFVVGYISFVPGKDKVVQGDLSIGFAKPYLHNVPPVLVRHLFCEKSREALVTKGQQKAIDGKNIAREFMVTLPETDAAIEMVKEAYRQSSQGVDEDEVYQGSRNTSVSGEKDRNDEANMTVPGIVVMSAFASSVLGSWAFGVGLVGGAVIAIIAAGIAVVVGAAYIVQRVIMQPLIVLRRVGPEKSPSQEELMWAIKRIGKITFLLKSGDKLDAIQTIEGLIDNNKLNNKLRPDILGAAKRTLARLENVGNENASIMSIGIAALAGLPVISAAGYLGYLIFGTVPVIFSAIAVVMGYLIVSVGRHDLAAEKRDILSFPADKDRAYDLLSLPFKSNKKDKADILPLKLVLGFLYEGNNESYAVEALQMLSDNGVLDRLGLAGFLWDYEENYGTTNNALRIKLLRDEINGGSKMKGATPSVLDEEAKITVPGIVALAGFAAAVLGSWAYGVGLVYVSVIAVLAAGAALSGYILYNRVLLPGVLEKYFGYSEDASANSVTGVFVLMAAAVASSASAILFPVFQSMSLGVIALIGITLVYFAYSIIKGPSNSDISRIFLTSETVNLVLAVIIQAFLYLFSLPRVSWTGFATVMALPVILGITWHVLVVSYKRLVGYKQRMSKSIKDKKNIKSIINFAPKLPRPVAVFLLEGVLKRYSRPDEYNIRAAAVSLLFNLGIDIFDLMDDDLTRVYYEYLLVRFYSGASNNSDSDPAMSAALEMEKEIFPEKGAISLVEAIKELRKIDLNNLKDEVARKNANFILEQGKVYNDTLTSIVNAVFGKEKHDVFLLLSILKALKVESAEQKKEAAAYQAKIIYLIVDKLNADQGLQNTSVHKTAQNGNEEAKITVPGIMALAGFVAVVLGSMALGVGLVYGSVIVVLAAGAALIWYILINRVLALGVMEKYFGYSDAPITTSVDEGIDGKEMISVDAQGHKGMDENATANPVTGVLALMGAVLVSVVSVGLLTGILTNGAYMVLVGGLAVSLGILGVKRLSTNSKIVVDSRREDDRNRLQFLKSLEENKEEGFTTPGAAILLLLTVTVASAILFAVTNMFTVLPVAQVFVVGLAALTAFLAFQLQYINSKLGYIGNYIDEISKKNFMKSLEENKKRLILIFAATLVMVALTHAVPLSPDMAMLGSMLGGSLVAGAWTVNSGGRQARQTAKFSATELIKAAVTTLPSAVINIVNVSARTVSDATEIDRVLRDKSVVYIGDMPNFDVLTQYAAKGMRPAAIIPYDGSVGKDNLLFHLEVLTASGEQRKVDMYARTTTDGIGVILLRDTGHTIEGNIATAMDGDVIFAAAAREALIELNQNKRLQEKLETFGVAFAKADNVELGQKGLLAQPVLCNDGAAIPSVFKGTLFFDAPDGDSRKLVVNRESLDSMAFMDQEAVAKVASGDTIPLSVFARFLDNKQYDMASPEIAAKYDDTAAGVAARRAETLFFEGLKDKAAMGVIGNIKGSAMNMPVSAIRVEGKDSSLGVLTDMKAFFLEKIQPCGLAGINLFGFIDASCLKAGDTNIVDFGQYKQGSGKDYVDADQAAKITFAAAEKELAQLKLKKSSAEYKAWDTFAKSQKEPLAPYIAKMAQGHEDAAEVYMFMQWKFTDQLKNSIRAVQTAGGSVYFTIEIDHGNINEAYEAIEYWLSFGFNGVHIETKEASLLDATRLAAAVNTARDARVYMTLPEGTGEGIKSFFKEKGFVVNVAELGIQGNTEKANSILAKVRDAFKTASFVFCDAELLWGKRVEWFVRETDGQRQHLFYSRMPLDSELSGIDFVHRFANSISNVVPQLTPEESYEQGYCEGTKFKGNITPAILENIIKIATRPSLSIARKDALQAVNKDNLLFNKLSFMKSSDNTNDEREIAGFLRRVAEDRLYAEYTELTKQVPATETGKKSLRAMLLAAASAGISMQELKDKNVPAVGYSAYGNSLIAAARALEAPKVTSEQVRAAINPAVNAIIRNGAADSSLSGVKTDELKRAIADIIYALDFVDEQRKISPVEEIRHNLDNMRSTKAVLAAA